MHVWYSHDVYIWYDIHQYIEDSCLHDIDLLMTGFTCVFICSLVPRLLGMRLAYMCIA